VSRDAGVLDRAPATVPGARRARASWRGLLPWLGAALVLAAAPLVFTSATALTMMSLMGIMTVFALSYNMLLGQTGLLSFGHAVYYGLGAFCAIHAMNAVIAERLPVPVFAIPLAGALAGLGFGLVFGAVSTRRAGTAFAMISLGLGELVASSANVLRSFFGGEEGITTNRAKLYRVLDLSFGPPLQVYYLIATWCLLCAALMYGITRTPLGRMCNAVRENPVRVQFLGYDPHRVRLIAFALSGLFAGAAGALAAINFEIVNASYVGLGQSGTVLLAAYIGGSGHFAGPVIGAMLVTYLQTMLSDHTEIWQLYFGLLFIGIVAFAPGGLAGLVALHAPLWRARSLHRVLAPYALAIPPTAAAVAGALLLIEMAYHALAKGGDGPGMTMWGIALVVTHPLPWLAAAGLLALGCLGLRAAAARIVQAFAAAPQAGDQRAPR
jgi:branched-chain amino acid transport system permease protein